MSIEREPTPQVTELELRLQERVDYWHTYFSSTPPEQAAQYYSESLAELDNYWDELGFMGRQFMIFGSGEWAELEIDSEQVSDQNDHQLTLDSSGAISIQLRSGKIEGMTGYSRGFQIRQYNDDYPPTLSYEFEINGLTKNYNGLAIEQAQLYAQVRAKNARLLETTPFDARTHAASLIPDYHASQSKDEASEAVARQTAAQRYSDKLSTESDLFQSYVRSNQFRWRRHDKQIAIIRYWLDTLDEEIPLFGHEVEIEASQIIVNTSDLEDNQPGDKYKLVTDEKLNVVGVCGSIVMPGLDELFRKPIRSDKDMVFFAGGLCMSVIPLQPIYVPKVQSYLPQSGAVYIPISSQNYSATFRFSQ
jgi:hypothetical protein